jgi:hypothetical protein
MVSMEQRARGVEINVDRLSRSIDKLTTSRLPA